MENRANLDPELSELVKKYGLFKEEEDDWNRTRRTSFLSNTENHLP